MRRYSDADYLGDNDTHESVTGYIIIINIVVIDWFPSSQKTVTLSVTGAEYSEIMGVCFEILFVRVVLLFMGVIVK